MTTAERVYRLLLRAYPSSFRAAYRGEMEMLFRDRRRERHGAGFWGETASDVARSAPAERLEGWSGHRQTFTAGAEMMAGGVETQQLPPPVLAAGGAGFQGTAPNAQSVVPR